MKDDAETLIGYANKVLELAELALHAAPEDRTSLERTIRIDGRALLAVAQAQEAVQRAGGLTEEAEADMVFRQSELMALLAELRILQQNIPK
jgi:hypothetical protein